MIKIVVAAVLFLGIDALVIKSGENNDDQLLAVAVYFRHGDRTPKESFPTDQHFTKESFPEGFGQLTNNGINRQYQLGQWLRTRYADFLPKKYSPNDILVKSTDVDRTLMSAAANLAGLYPPEEDLVWNRDLLWRPIPVHTVAQSDDAVLAMKKDCPALNKLYKKQKKSDYYQELNAEYAELYEFVSQYSGLNVTDISDIKLIRSVFYCYKHIHPCYIPSWGSGLNQTELDYLAAMSYARHSATDKMKRLRAGPFLDYLINYFDGVVANASETVKFMMFSSHDSPLVSVLDAMGVYDMYPPNFASTIIWELKEDAEDNAYVNLFYRRNETEFFDLTIPGCAADCPVDDFKTILEPVTIDLDKWEKKCADD